MGALQRLGTDSTQRAPKEIGIHTSDVLRFHASVTSGSDFADQGQEFEISRVKERLNPQSPSFSVAVVPRSRDSTTSFSATVQALKGSIDIQ